jgi:hypothetical protein
VALAVVAEADRRQRPGLRQAIMAQLPEELVMQSWVYKQGLEQGLEKGLRLLERVFERRLGHPLSAADRSTLRRRFETLGAERLGDVALELSPEALAAWLNDPNAR